MEKQFIVVGGSKGIGADITSRLLDQGARVTVFSRSIPDFSHENMTFKKIDILNEEIDSSDLPDHIDGLVYCPGSINLKPIRSLKVEDFKNDFDINVIGAVKAIKSCLSGLKKSSNNPSILLFSTVAVARGMAFHASVSSAKGAVEGLTKSLSAELAPSIRVNAIAPSLVSTGLAENLLSSPEKQESAAQRHPLKRYGQPEDISKAALYLLSEDASWVTGQIMHIDGGLSVI